MSFSDNVLYCPECGKVSEYPVCCGKEMDLDNETFFCNICGNERKLSVCCEKKMIVTKKELLGGVFT